VAVLADIFISRYFGTSGDAGDEQAAAGLTMLVVLPFENLGSPDDAYFDSGTTEAITARLVGLSGLGVISRQELYLAVLQEAGSGISCKGVGCC